MKFPKMVGRDILILNLGLVKKTTNIKQQTSNKTSVYADLVKQQYSCAVFSIELPQNSKVML